MEGKVVKCFREKLREGAKRIIRIDIASQANELNHGFAVVRMNMA